MPNEEETPAQKVLIELLALQRSGESPSPKVLLEKLIQLTSIVAKLEPRK